VTPKSAPGKPAPGKPIASKSVSRKPATQRSGLLPTLPGDRPWTEKEVGALRIALDEEAADLRGEIDEASAAFDRSLQDGDPTTGDEADAGSATFEREHDLSLAANSRDLLAQVQRAIERLDAGTYGRCEVCGDAIGKERLKAFPRVTLCVTCKQRENRR
jgi:DnaK suppressor protein